MVQPVCESCYLPTGSWRPPRVLEAKGGFMLPGSVWICWGREGDNAAHKEQGALLEMNLIFLILVMNEERCLWPFSSQHVVANLLTHNTFWAHACLLT